VAVADVKIDNLIESIFVTIENWTACRILCVSYFCAWICTCNYCCVMIWTSQVSGKQIVKNTKINGIDRPTGPDRAGLFIHRAGPDRADILMHLNGPGRAEDLSGRAGLGIFGPCRALVSTMYPGRVENTNRLEGLFCCSSYKAWNSLPQSLRDTTSTATFKRHLKTHIFLVTF